MNCCERFALFGRGSDARGSVLFLILIAVMLFAALSYAMTRSSATGPADRTAEDAAAIKSSQILQHATTVEQAVMRMRIGGAMHEQISFHTPAWGHTNYRHTPEAPDAYKIFHPGGGAVSWSAPPQEANDGSEWQITGAFEVSNVGSTCGGADCAELVMILPNITKAICDVINERIGILGGQENVSLTAVGTSFTGSFTAADVIGNEGIAPGTTTGCYEGSGIADNAPADTYHFFHVILPR